MKSEQLMSYFASPQMTVVEAMQKIDLNTKGILFVVEQENHLLGVVTDGDIRRWLIKTGNMKEQLGRMMNRSPRLIYRKDVAAAQEFMVKYSITALPVVTAKGNVVDILFSPPGKIRWETRRPPWYTISI